MKKRIISATLASLLAVSALSTSAFAAGLKTDGAVSATGSVNVPTLKVSVPSTAGFVANPYRLAVKVKGDANANASQIIPTYGAGNNSWAIINNSDEVAINGKVYATYKAGKSVEVNGTADPDKRNITLGLNLAGLASSTADAATPQAITLVDTAPEEWSDTNVKSFYLAKKETGSKNNQADITLTGSLDDVGTETWTESDTVSITMAFKFDFVINDTWAITFASKAEQSVADAKLPANIEIVKGTKLNQPNDPTSELATFDKWTNGTSDVKFPLKITAATTLTANWKAPWTITLKYGDDVIGTVKTDENGKVTVADVVAILEAEEIVPGTGKHYKYAGTGIAAAGLAADLAAAVFEKPTEVTVTFENDPADP